ncbi:MAG: biopolymer transporter ExbD [Pseudomonadota bacterium]
MGVSVDSGGGGKSVDVDINLVPFIDLMSCLVAFLLVTAAWTNLAQINIKPKGVGRDVEKQMPENRPILLSILITKDSHWVGLTTGDRQLIKKNGNEYDYRQLETVIEDYKKSVPEFQSRQDVEIAAEDGVNYQAVISTMDCTIAKGFPDIGFLDPNSLSTKFRQ